MICVLSQLETEVGFRLFNVNNFAFNAPFGDFCNMGGHV